MIEITTQKDLTSLIRDQIEEGLNLEYKASKALENTVDISKDVSAMANSAGGLIIYGIREYDIKEKRHLPEKIDPVNRLICSKEKLEQIINNNIDPP